MDRCTRCILPTNYPGIQMDAQGVCQYCKQDKQKINYVGLDSFVKEMRAFQEKHPERNKDYDCLLGFSGGRDSTYLLYLLTKQLGLSVLCYNADHGYVPEVTTQNMNYATDILKSKLVIEKHDYLKQSLRHVLATWMHRPSMPMIETFCTGCKRGIESGTIAFAQKNKIPVVIRGETPFEFPNYRYNLIRLYPQEGWLPMMFGYGACVAKNPLWFTNLTYVDNQVKDFMFFHDFKKNFRDHGLILLEPFLGNIRWEEKVVMSTIEKELHWSKNPRVRSSWRGDCSVALLKLYVYNNILGFNDKTEGLSYLIRDGQITRDEALERVKQEENVPEDIIQEILQGLGLKLTDFSSATARLKERYSQGKRF